MEIDKIVSDAIPPETCPVKEAHAQWRRERLKERILAKIREELQNMQAMQPWTPQMQYKDGQTTLPNSLP
jgi:hypothetical protein